MLGDSQLHTPHDLAPLLLLKTHWRRRSEGRDLWLSYPVGFKEAKREDARIMQLRIFMTFDYMVVVMFIQLTCTHKSDNFYPQNATHFERW
jgi:hypothetical protein